MLRQLIFSQGGGGGGEGDGAGPGQDEHEDLLGASSLTLPTVRAAGSRRAPTPTVQLGPPSEDDALLEQGRLGAAIWRRKGLKNDDAGLDAPALRWRRVGMRPGPKAPLYHWPTSLLPAFSETPRLLHLDLLRRALFLLRAANDTGGVATVVRLLQGTDPARLDLGVIEANLWLLQREHARLHAKRRRRQQQQIPIGAMPPPPTGMADPSFRRIVLLLRALMGTRILLPQGPDGDGAKSGNPPDALRVLALARLTSFLLLLGPGAGAGCSRAHVAQAKEMLQQEAFLRPFSDSPHLLLARALVGSVDILHRGPPAAAAAPALPPPADDALARLAHAPLASLALVAEAEGDGGLEAVVQESARAYDAAATPEGRDAAFTLHASLLALSAKKEGRRRRRRGASDGSDEEGEEAGASDGGRSTRTAVLRLLREHTQGASASAGPAALRTAHRVAAFLLGQDHKQTLGYLREWAAADPTADAAVRALVHAYRRQLLRSYRDPSAPVRVGKARVVRVLLERLASLPPSDAYCPSSEGPGGRRLLYFRWLAHYLGPVPATSDERSTWLLGADGCDAAQAQEVMAGRFQAWSPCLRAWGAEEMALDLFPLREVLGGGGGAGGEGEEEEAAFRRARAPFHHKWYEAEAAGWPWPPPPPLEGGQRQEEWRRAEALWAAVKYGPTGLGNRAEEEQEEDEEQEQEEERVPAAWVDDGEEGWLGKAEGGDGERLAGLLLLAYKALVAAHLMGPANGYTTAAVRLLWDRAHALPAPSPSPSPLPALLGMLHGKFRLDVPGLLRASDRLLLLHHSLSSNPPTTRLGPDPVALGLVAAGTAWPLPALHPPTLLPPAPMACPPAAGRHRPRPLPPVDEEGRAARRLKEAFGKAVAADPQAQKRRRLAEGKRAQRRKKKEEEEEEEEEEDGGEVRQQVSSSVAGKRKQRAEGSK